MSEVNKPIVLVTVGTDHHPFHRMIDWVDAWLAAGAQDRVQCVVQYGYSKAPELAEGSDLIPHERLQELMRTASIVVSHGGPTTIMEARRRGLIPVVVPRQGRLGEHVDNHQELFAGRMAAGDLVRVAATQQEFIDTLEAALADPATLAIPDFDGEASTVIEASARFGELAAELTGTGTPLPRTPVLFIGGSGRSGTTLLERLLGQIQGVHAAGELVHLWERGVVGNELCGCGTPFASCDVWHDVGKRAYGGWEQLDQDWTISTRWAVDRTRRVPWLMVPALATPFYRRRLRAWARQLGSLYEALAASTAADVVIDSSKHLSYALLLRHVRVNLRVVVVVRDPRAVAFSWSKVEVRPEITESEEYMPQFGAVKSSLLWVVNTVGYRMLRLARVPVTLVRYEDLVTEPAATLARIAEFASVSGKLPELVDNSLTLRANHTAAGNPMRMKVGPLTLRKDSRWQGELSWVKAFVTTAITWPWLLRFGYPIRWRRSAR